MKWARNYPVSQWSAIKRSLKKLKCQNGAEFDWLWPFPGDWHVPEKNFQPNLMKIFFHAGLKDVAITARYNGGYFGRP